MSKQVRFILCLSFLSWAYTSSGQFTYISPMPESKMHNKETGIILRTGELVDPSSLNSDLFSVYGSVSGKHDIKVKLAADEKTILVWPTPLFSSGETVTVTIHDGIKNLNERIIIGTSFWFQIRKDFTAKQQQAINDAHKESDESEGGVRLLCDHIPSFTITSTPGAYYDEPLCYWNFTAAPLIPNCWTETIISSDGDSIYAYQENKIGFDFKLNDNGYLTSFNVYDTCFDMLDSSYTLVKKFHMGNGYVPNKHEFRIFPNGNHFMQCFDDEIVDMSQFGGQPDAVVTGSVIQELDSNDNVIFEWRSWDHLQITDAANDILLTTNNVDYVHCNSIDLDVDGNLLISSRNLDEITKINLNTGDIIWRMGGENNEFTFINDTDAPKPFSHQHHFRRLSNGHYSLFDDGDFQNPQRSSAKEFELDQVNKTATLVWSYVHPQVNGYNVYGSSLGSVQTLPNGNRFINWGQISANVAYADIPNFTEVDSNGNIVWEFWFEDSTYVSYQAFKFPWDRCNLITDSLLIADSITATSADLHWNTNTKFSGFTLEYKECDSLTWNQVPLDTNFYHLDGLQLNTCYDWRVESVCAMFNDSFYTSPHQFTTLNPLSAFEPANELLYFKLFPNPASTETELNFFSKEDCETEITIYDLLGAIVANRTVTAQRGINRSRFDVHFMPSGIYSVELKLTSNLLYGRLVIQ